MKKYTGTFSASKFSRFSVVMSLVVFVFSKTIQISCQYIIPKFWGGSLPHQIMPIQHVQRYSCGPGNKRLTAELPKNKSIVGIEVVVGPHHHSFEFEQGGTPLQPN